MYKNEIKEIKDDIKVTKIMFVILCIIILITLITFLILNKCGVVNDTTLNYVSTGALCGLIFGTSNAYTDIQNDNEKIADIQQKEIEELENKLSEKEGD